MTKLHSLLDEALEAWAYARAGVIDELKAFPDNALGFRPNEEARTVADLIRHIVESNLMMSGELSRANGDFQRKSFEGFLQEYGRGIAAHRTKKQLLEALRRTHREGEAQSARRASSTCCSSFGASTEKWARASPGCTTASRTRCTIAASSRPTRG